MQKNDIGTSDGRDNQQDTQPGNSSKHRFRPTPMPGTEQMRPGQNTVAGQLGNMTGVFGAGGYAPENTSSSPRIESPQSTRQEVFDPMPHGAGKWAKWMNKQIDIHRQMQNINNNIKLSREAACQEIYNNLNPDRQQAYNREMQQAYNREMQTGIIYTPLPRSHRMTIEQQGSIIEQFERIVRKEEEGTFNKDVQRRPRLDEPQAGHSFSAGDTTAHPSTADRPIEDNIALTHQTQYQEDISHRDGIGEQWTLAQYSATIGDLKTVQSITKKDINEAIQYKSPQTDNELKSLGNLIPRAHPRTKEKKANSDDFVKAWDEKAKGDNKDLKQAMRKIVNSAEFYIRANRRTLKN